MVVAAGDSTNLPALFKRSIAHLHPFGGMRPVHCAHSTAKHQYGQVQSATSGRSVPCVCA